MIIESINLKLKNRNQTKSMELKIPKIKKIFSTKKNMYIFIFFKFSRMTSH